MPTFELFCRQLAMDPARQFVVLEKSGRTIGWLKAYNEDPGGAFAWVGVFMSDDVQGSGLGIEAVGMFIHYLFSFRPYRKLYANATESSYKSFGSGAGVYFHVEGIMRQHEYYDGEFRYRMILAVYAQEWRDIMKQKSWVPRLGFSLEVN